MVLQCTYSINFGWVFLDFFLRFCGKWSNKLESQACLLLLHPEASDDGFPSAESGICQHQTHVKGSLIKIHKLTGIPASVRVCFAPSTTSSNHLVRIISPVNSCVYLSSTDTSATTGGPHSWKWIGPLSRCPSLISSSWLMAPTNRACHLDPVLIKLKLLKVKLGRGLGYCVHCGKGSR